MARGKKKLYKVEALTNIYSTEYHVYGEIFEVEEEEYNYLKKVNAINLVEEEENIEVEEATTIATEEGE